MLTKEMVQDIPSEPGSLLFSRGFRENIVYRQGKMFAQARMFLRP